MERRDLERREEKRRGLGQAHTLQATFPEGVLGGVLQLTRENLEQRQSRAIGTEAITGTYTLLQIVSCPAFVI